LYKPSKDARIIFLGLDASGRTALLYKLKQNEFVTTIPTIGFNVETVPCRDVSLTIWDVGGCDKIRPLWRHYFENTSVAVFCIASNDAYRLDASIDELKRLIEEDALKDTPFLILLTKTDIECKTNEINVSTLEKSLEAANTPKIPIIPISTKQGDGLDSMLDWLHAAVSGEKEEIQTPVDECKNTNETTKKNEENSELEKKMEFWLSRPDLPAQEFLQSLYDYTLDSWDHYTHLRIAYVLLEKYGRREGMNKIFSSIKNFIANSSITKRSRGTTFHESMTYFWAHMVHFAMASSPDGAVKDDFKVFVVMNPQLANGGLFLEYYSKELMLQSPESRLKVVLPDKKQLPSIVSDTGNSNNNNNSSTNGMEASTPKKKTSDATFYELVLQGRSPAMGHDARLRVIWIALKQDMPLRERRKQAFAAVQRLDGPQGYHETETYVWIQLITLAIAKEKEEFASFHEFIDKFNDFRQFDYIGRYYSPSCLEKGKHEFVLPDKKALPNVL